MAGDSVLLLPVMAFRRARAKDPRAVDGMMTVLRHLVAPGALGAATAEAVARDLQPAPPPGHAGRQAWTARPRPGGPVQLILYSLHLMGAALDKDAAIHQYRGPAIPILGGPIQWVRRHVDALGARAVYRALQREHTGFCGVEYLGKDLTMDLLRFVADYPGRARRAAGRQSPPSCSHF